MKLWQQYIAEREDAKIIFTDHSFVTYRNLDESRLLVLDLFVEREYRKTGLVEKMWDEMIEKEKPYIVFGTTDTSALNWEASNRFMISFGFIPYKTDQDIIHYYREINHG